MNPAADRFVASTGPLNRRPVPAAAEDVAAGLALSREVIGRVEPHIELLLRACEASRIVVPGVGQEPYRHAPPPNALALLKHLVALLGRRTELVREIQIAIFRFYDARAALAALEAAAQPSVDGLAELRRKVFYLTHYYGSLRGDPVLDQMFPPPETRQVGSAPLAPLPPAAAGRSEAAGRKLEAALLLERTSGWVPLLELALEAVNDPARMMKLVLARDLKPARLLLLRLQGAPDAHALAREVLASWHALDAALRDEAAALATVAEGHADLSQRCLAHPLLGDLLKALPGRG